MVKSIALGVVAVLAVAVVVVLALAAMKPDRFSVQRTASIKAPPERIIGLIDDFHRWSEWSPYEKLDPAMKRSFAGPARGPGATYAWESGGKAGTGRMEILETAPASKVTIKLDFTKPFEASNIAAFTLRPRGEMTDVTWSMDGPTPYLAKIVHVFLNMDRLVGGDFETGLANMKAAAEK